ncbi:indolepyruvate ferredoxin oxidoreductase [Rhodothalassium salexigens]|uniref:indolepyruvate ferredoxin oxidoreductase subunit alpha n=1 Tax=Rhodothalassium salexigens TaxID=1086 RepID=UPI0019112671|nr:indolepyruvate ferredoxin oxidoreductase subunit alpha [Rhodothalassium salexigens]MBK5919944.1 indolepyruvate ferredoxin oxidoreductase [Rhodothalassium salexigens]
MAERSFTQEADKLRLGAGETFRGEGILAVTKALLQSGVAYVGGYQGAPVSHLMDVLADAEPVLDELGVHFEASASEATAGAMLAASVNYPLRGAVTWKSTVGTNVASDALANVASGGVTGGALVIVGEDYGEGSSIMQERTHAFAMKSQMWLLDPRPNLTAIVHMVEKGFELSEASHTPVMLELRIRACHVYGRFEARDNRRPPLGLAQAMANPVRDTGRIVLPPANFAHEHEKIAERLPAAVAFIKRHRLNEFLGGAVGPCGIVVQGGLYNTLIRALELLGRSDAFGNTDLPIYVLNVAYPLIDDEIVGFCADKSSVLLLEEGQPNYIEQAFNHILRRRGLDTRVVGKDLLPMAGEYTGAVVRDALVRYLAQDAGHSAEQGEGQGADTGTEKSAGQGTDKAAPVAPGHNAAGLDPSVADSLAATVPARPAGFCTGCPERPVFSAMKLLEAEMGPFHISCDIGCHLFSILPPFNLGNTTMGYGLGWAGASAFNVPADRRTISVMGDGGFWHNGLASGVGNAVFNRNDNVLVIIDNSYSAATGGQDLLSSRGHNPRRSTRHTIQDALKGVGVEWVRTVDTYKVSTVKATLREALTTRHKGPKVIVAENECMLTRQRREKPLVRQRLAAGERVVRERFGVDADTCTGDHSCIRLSGCPSLTVKPNPDPLRDSPVAHVTDDCVACGLCGEIAHAARLCPSFYRADVIQNPGPWDRRLARWRGRVIGFFQARADKARARAAF